MCGGTGAGKTTLLAAMLGAVSPTERIVCVEDAAELAPRHPHLVKLVARCANVEGVGEVPVRQLVRQALRMRPDRIVVGEVRGAEVVDLLAALNTGHDGGAGTVHANNPGEVPARLEALGALGGLDRAALHSQLAAAVQVLLHVARDRSGRRRLAEIAVLRQIDGRVRAVTVWHADRGHRPTTRAICIACCEAGCRHERRRGRCACCWRWRSWSFRRHRGDGSAAATPIRRRVAVGTRGGRLADAPCAAVAAATLLPLTTVLAAAVVAATAACATGAVAVSGAPPTEGRTLEAALDVLVGELRVGSHPVRAFGVAADETVGAVADVAARGRGPSPIGCRRRSRPARRGTIVGPARALGSTGGVLAAGQRPRAGDRHADAYRAARYR